MKLKTKKLIITGTLIPLAIAAPVAVAVSCGQNSNTTNKNTTTKQSNKNKTTRLDLNKEFNSRNHAAPTQPYSRDAVKGLDGLFKQFGTKYYASFTGPLKVQALKVMDAATIAFMGYLYADGSKVGDAKIKVAAAKKEFAANLRVLKQETDILFDMALMNPNSGVDILLTSMTKSATTQKLGKGLIRVIFKRFKLMLDNILDTMINLEEPTLPAWKTDASTTEVGTLKKLNTGSLSFNQVKKIREYIKNTMPGIAREIVKKPAGTYDVLSDGQLSITGGIGLIKAAAKNSTIRKMVVGDTKFKTPKQAMIDTGWQKGLQMFSEVATAHPENIRVFYNSKTRKVHLEMDDTTTHIANHFQKNMKYNEQSFGSILDDRFLNDFVITKLVKGGTIGMPSGIDGIKDLLKDKQKITNTLDKFEALLKDFGKMLQFTELNFQMLISNLLGNKAQYYGSFQPDGAGYAMMKESFTSPQFNVYDLKNYQSYNDHVDVKSNLVAQGSIKMALATAHINIELLRLVREVTKDPYSKYSIGILEILDTMKLDNIKF